MRRFCPNKLRCLGHPNPVTNALAQNVQLIIRPCKCRILSFLMLSPYPLRTSGSAINLMSNARPAFAINVD
ncbi:hypothetical protein IWW46_001516 [Coemansia sp. RSA 2440]|nr:hypothetical protein IWW46_001516 [Coemansia sp. RSA 2440]